jgi:hypothetical protein
MAYTDLGAKFNAHSAPLTKAHTTTPKTDERAELLAKAASCGDPMLLKGYQERLRDLPEPGPKLPADASAATSAMVDVLQARGHASPDRYASLGYFSRARSLQEWLDHGQQR